MACTICGELKTVRSHIIPKAFAIDIRAGAPHILAASLSHIGAKPMQGGPFSDHLLCHAHESLTAAVDKYAVEFVRRLNSEWRHRGGTEVLEVVNPQPELLKRFALLTIWREVCAKQVPGLSLGPYTATVGAYVFEDGTAPDWPVIVQRTNFTLPGKGAIDFGVHPYRVRFADRGGWAFTVAGAAFFVVSDQRGLPSIFSEWAVDRHNPARVTVSDATPFTDVGMLKPLLGKLAARNIR